MISWLSNIHKDLYIYYRPDQIFIKYLLCFTRDMLSWKPILFGFSFKIFKLLESEAVMQRCGRNEFSFSHWRTNISKGTEGVFNNTGIYARELRVDNITTDMWFVHDFEKKNHLVKVSPDKLNDYEKSQSWPRFL